MHKLILSTSCSCELKCLFSLLNSPKDTIYGLLKEFVPICIIVWMCRHIVGIPVATICVPIAAGLIQVWYERDFMLSLFGKSQANVVEVFNCTL